MKTLRQILVKSGFISIFTNSPVDYFSKFANAVPAYTNSSIFGGFDGNTNSGKDAFTLKCQRPLVSHF